MSKTKLLGLVLGPVSFILILFFFRPEGLSVQANAVLASTIWIAIWWITEAIPIAVTALLPLVLFPLSGGLDLSSTSGAFGHKYVFLYMGGFIIAIAIEKWNLHRRIALNIINLIGSDIRKIILGFMMATAFLSMWISNTATAVMMLPIGLAIIKQLQDNPDTVEDENQTFGKALMLAIAYSASIGGVATLIGTPPNLVLAGVILDTYGYEITFMQWFAFGLPISIILIFICWKYLTKYAFSFKQKSFPGGKQEIQRLLSSLGRITYEEKIVALVFALTAFCWITRSVLLQKLLPALDDTIIAIFFAIVLFLIPSKKKDEQLINWEEAVKMPWGIILLFGGGMALAKGFESSGLAEWIGSQMTTLSGLPILILILVLIASVNFLTEITSNLATTAMLLPVLAPMALTIDVHPFVLMVGAAVAASCAFMLPVATPPNAVVFGSGYLRIPDMVGKGLFMNIISIFILTFFVYFILPELWDISINSFPQKFK
ncbi:solute carrier family 13 (sodium-dependent dicarboxylate transporter), member 2/3/5 [Maribacter dokdonensis]|uniref:Solute carrier family 13 (Sodium-dependent dicarboxylate transporter), member 2/3/5 n=1 Tax=Maribacter dokdonensis TaxID=320912 RepID=A0A1H4K723_9FLAO|nr:DASS family sodium-coupled anion symporter [Maribacter dokdonensis]SDT43279.1 solute carrier family 13 (sodium-dependent dicarboxylate transporter), member 2/3/5 [Maribacter dokdonensis]SEB54324.1 solute carrier family 13 (sodium-dependent dicarboxylate transporter), member 2/3/5 [Maribacter dokdonensis]